MSEFVRVTLCVIFLPMVMMMSVLKASGQDRTQSRSMVISRRRDGGGGKSACGASGRHHPSARR